MTTRKWFVPFFYFVLFSFFSCVGGAWGLMVRSPHPPLGDIPLLPSAAGLVDRSPTNVIASRTPIAARYPFLTNFQFATNEKPDEVVAFYKSSMSRTYGFVGEWTESPSPGTTVIHFGRRAFRDLWAVQMITETVGSSVISTPTHVLYRGWALELVTVTVTSEGNGPTIVNVDLQIQPQP